MEQKAKTPEGDSARWRPRRLAEEAPAGPLGKRSRLRKGTAVAHRIMRFHAKQKKTGRFFARFF
ncbi:hypothetical protein FZC75_20760 [Sutcliffiella horikoshii]|uniref:Uncharacterized protein n=1 Tax=Sutcliffiella horikoshii TaxID=79883 RepID=A0A5D4SQL1_9BACI|nr:hypothetical protein FZC75_20760 [Sutcliffiella horikoshii]